MTYDELCESIIDDLEHFDPRDGFPKVITLSPKTFNDMVRTMDRRPALFGMVLEVDNLDPGVSYRITANRLF